MRRSLPGLLAVLAVALLADPASAIDFPAIHQLRDRAGIERPWPTQFDLPAGGLEVTPAELVAGAGEQTLRFAVALDRPSPGEELRVTLPPSWTEAGPSGLRAIGAPSLRGTRGRLRRDGADVVLAVEPGQRGAEFELRDVGVAAGTYRIPWSWEGTSGRSGHATVTFYAPEREGGAFVYEDRYRGEWARLSVPGIEGNVTADSTNESETHAAVVPGDSDRLAVSINGGAFSVWISENAGQTFTKRVMPTKLDLPGSALEGNLPVCCDPMFAADHLGNIWLGALSVRMQPPQDGRIVVNRIAAGTTILQTRSTALPRRVQGSSALQDKPLMTIDDSPSSPTFGRLYVVWSESRDSNTQVLSACDTRVAGLPVPARCDIADNWSAPAAISVPGSNIGTDVAVDRGGRVHVVWWDFSAPVNAIVGKTCAPPADCRNESSWSGAQHVVATLDATTGQPVPFNCPILAQPGGRSSPLASISVDRSGGPQDGRVYVAWSDLTGAGTTRCAEDPQGGGTQPASTHRRWDGWIATAVDQLPGPGTSAAVGLPVIEAGENADDWFPTVATDDITGQTWVSLYSTKDDAARKKTHHYVRAVGVNASALALGATTQVSSAQSDYSDQECCTFGNDYGDYQSLEATEGIAYPVWSQRLPGQDGEAVIFRGLNPSLQLVQAGAVAVEAGGDGDGVVEAGEPADVTPSVRNTSTVAATGVTATLDATAAGASVVPAVAGFPDIAPNATAAAATPFRVTMPASAASCRVVDFRLTLTVAGPGTERVPVLVGTQCPVTATTGDAVPQSFGATLRGTVNPAGVPTSYRFDYGTSAPPPGGSYTSSTAVVALAQTATPQAVSATVSGLTASTTYHFRLVALPDGAAEMLGSDQTFVTSEAPPAPPPAPSPEPTPTAVPETTPVPTAVATTVPPTRAAVDSDPPVLDELEVTGSRRLATVSRSGLKAEFNVSEAALVGGELLVTRSVARRLGVRGTGSLVAIGHGSVRLDDANAARMVLRIDRAARTRFKRQRKVTVTLRLTGVDASGNRGRLTGRVALRR